MSKVLPSAVTYSEDDIRSAVTENAFRAGQIYQTQRRVLSFDIKEDGTLHSRVLGNERQPYEQTIAITRTGGDIEIAGACTCPVGFNCKHVAAALLYGRANPSSRAAVPQTALRLFPGSPPLTPSQTAAAPAEPHERLPPDLAGWLDELDRARVTADETYPASITQRLVYILMPVTRGGRSVQLAVRLFSVRLLKDGRFSETGRTYAPDADAAASGAGAKFLRPSDHRIMRALVQSRREFYSEHLMLFHDSAAPILADILATGRARWLSANGPALAAGDPRPGRIVWATHDQKEMRPTLDAGEGVLVCNAMPPVYVDAAAGLIGPIETGLAPKLAAALLGAPPVPADHIAALGNALRRRAPELANSAPNPPGPPEIVTVPPAPCLRLFMANLPVATPANRAFYGFDPPREPVALGRPSFRYGTAQVAAGESRPRVTQFQGDHLVEIRRDAGAEGEHLRTLAAHGFAPAVTTRPGTPQIHAHDVMPEGDDLAWLDAMYHDVPALRAKGWRIEIDDDFPFRVVRGDGRVDAEVRESSGIDWFELDLGILVDGERIDLIEPIVALITSPGFNPATFELTDIDDEPVYLKLGDGRVLAVPFGRIAPIVAAIQDLAAGALVGGRLRLNPADAVGLAVFEEATAGAGLVWRGGERLRDMGHKLGSAGVPAVTVPATFTATLRPYQAQGVSWLAFLRDVGFGGVLADDMGLGKTVQALAFIAIEKAEGRLDRPALVVAPTSLMANWRREAERFAPDLRVLILQGLDRKSRFGEIGTSDLVLTTYPLIARDHAVLGQTSWHLLLLDEAQMIKNPDAATTKLIVDLDARHRFCLSGTPLENNLGELWSLFSFVLPGFLGDRSSFTRQWRTPIEKSGDGARAKMLARRIKPFLLRRTKEEVAGDLPPKTEIVERVEFQQGQRDIYEAIRLSMHARVSAAIAQKGFARSRIVILDALLKLRQVCCDPRLLKPMPKSAAKAGSAKLERLEEMLSDLLAENRRILVFSQFTSMLALIQARLDARGQSYALLTGDTRDRERQVSRFQDRETPLFLVSLKAGGTGLNLTAADTVILYDPWWNPAVEEQAIDRAHRIGQDKPVFVHKLVASGTIEEKMEVLKDKKRALAASLFDQDGAPTLAMTEADLDMLFSAD